MNPKSAIYPLCLFLLLATGCADTVDGDALEAAGPDAAPLPVQPDASPPQETSCALTCSGCCDGDVCRSGEANSACGSDGATCRDCGSRGLCDLPSHSCEIDPSSRWNIHAVSGVVPDQKENGDAWDVGGGAPDAFASAKLDDEQLGRSATAQDTFTPEWNELLIESIRHEDVPKVLLELVDDDLGSDDVVGRCLLPSFSFEAYQSNAAQTINCSDGAGYTFSLLLQPE